MSSKRGRKRNDNLPPNRARDVQRAFRARRAAHLEALEQRVAELEEENNTLRAALNLPPANRPPLGRGPTGKDKPKASTSKSPPAVATGIGAILPSIPALTSSGTLPPMSRTESPLSTGSTSAHSMSPDPVLSNALPLPQPTTQDLDPTGWSDSMFGTKESNPPLSSSAFSLPPSAASLGRSTTSDLFSGSIQDKFSGFPSSDEKSFGYLPSEERRTFSYPHSLLSGQPPSSLPPSLQAPNGVNGGGDAVAAAVAGGAELPPSLPAFLQRRSLTEPDSFRTLLNQMSHVQPTQNSLHTPIPRMSTSALLNAVDSHMSEYDLPGGAERRYPRLH